MPRPSTLLLLALVHGATAFMGGGKGSKGGCGVMAWYSQCKKDMSLLKDPSKIGSFCKTGCYTWMVKNHCDKSTDKTMAQIKPLMKMCTHSSSGGCTMMGFAQNCRAFMNSKGNKGPTINAAFCKAKCGQFLIKQHCGKTGILNMPGKPKDAAEMKKGFMALETMCTQGDGASGKCSLMSVMGPCEKAADDLKDESCSSKCAKALVPCVGTLYPWLQRHHKEIGMSAKDMAKVKPFAKRCASGSGH